MSDAIERCILVKPEVFVYKIPPRASARGYRAADWNLSAPDWTGRMRVMTGGKIGGKICELRLEDRGSNELFAACPVENYPGLGMEAVTDSSRYFVICILDKESGRKAYIGIGFADRADSFDLNVALQDHFKGIKKEIEFAKEAEVNDSNGLGAVAGAKLDLAFKEGQTIRINIPKEGGSGRERSVKKGATGVLPPPPGGSCRIGPPPSIASLTPLQSPSEPTTSTVIGGLNDAATAPKVSSVDLLGDFNLNAPAPAIPPLLASAPSSISGYAASSSNSISDFDSGDPWGDFTSAPLTNSTASSGAWEKF